MNQKKILIFLLLCTAMPLVSARAGELQKVVIKYIEGNFQNKARVADHDVKGQPATGARPDSHPHYLYLTLANPEEISEIRIYWDQKDRPETYEVGTGSDYLRWKKVSVQPKTHRLKDGRVEDVFTLSEEVATYVRVFVPKTKKDSPKELRIAEVEVYTRSSGDLSFEKVGTTLIGDTFVHVGCELNRAASVQVLYGLNLENMVMAPLSFSTSRSHIYQINGLTPGTRYFFQMQARAGNDSLHSRYYKFQTTGEAPLYFSGLETKADTDHAELTIMANKPIRLTCELEEINPLNKKLLGADIPQKKSSVERKKFRKIHHVSWKGLHPGWKYRFMVRGISRKSEQVLSKQQGFRTPRYNVAYRKKATGTFDALPNGRFIQPTPPALERLTDGKLSYFSSMATSGSVAQNDQFVTMDLGSIYSIRYIVVFWRALAYSRDYSLQGSLDGKKWFSFAKGIDAAGGSRTKSETGDPLLKMETGFPRKKARWIKLFVPQNSKKFVKHKSWNFVQIAEIKVISE